MVAQTAEFKKAVEDSRTMTQQPTNDELLEMYALFKQGTQDPKYEDATKPGMFDLKGKKKYEAWGNVKGLKSAEAQTKYVALVKKLVVKYK